MLHSGSKPRNSNKICIVCNLEAVENEIHFISVCPTLTHFRCKYLKNKLLSRDKPTCLLVNKENCTSVAFFVKDTINFKKIIIEEMNIYNSISNSKSNK